jgi:hypothetical protein
VADITPEATGLLAQDGIVPDPLVRIGQVNESIEPGIQESAQALAGLGFVKSQGGVFPGQKPPGEDPVGSRDGFIAHGLPTMPPL